MEQQIISRYIHLLIDEPVQARRKAMFGTGDHMYAEEEEERIKRHVRTVLTLLKNKELEQTRKDLLVHYGASLDPTPALVMEIVEKLSPNDKNLLWARVFENYKPRFR